MSLFCLEDRLVKESLFITNINCLSKNHLSNYIDQFDFMSIHSIKDFTERENISTRCIGVISKWQKKQENMRLHYVSLYIYFVLLSASAKKRNSSFHMSKILITVF